MMRKGFQNLILTVCAVPFLTVPAFAQSNTDINNRLNRIENEITTLGRAVYKGDQTARMSLNSGPADAALASAEAQTQFQALQEELRSLNGKIEEQAFEIRQLRQALDKLQNSTEARLQAVETSPAASAPRASQQLRLSSTPINPSPIPGNTPASQPVPTTAVVSPLPRTPSTLPTGAVANDATAQYENAFALLKQGQYNLAQVKFEDFLKVFPDHQLASNAKYWLGEAHYVRGEFDQAARIFAEGYQQYPQGSKAADNLLKLGISLSALEKKTEACVALSQIEKSYADGAVSVVRRAKQEMAKLECDA